MRLGLAALGLAALYGACGPAATTPSATAGTGLPTPPKGDGDADGYDGNVDCDDADPAIHPGAREITCDSVDNDCQGGDERRDCTLDSSEADYAFQVNGSTYGWTIAGDLDGVPGDDAVDLWMPDTGNTFAIYGAIATGAPTEIDVRGTPASTAGDATGDGRDDLWVRDYTTGYLLAGPIQPGVNLARDAVAVLTGMEPYDKFQAFGHEDVDGDGLADLVDAIGIACPGRLVGQHDVKDVCFETPTFYHNGWDEHLGTGDPRMNGDLTGDGVADLVTGGGTGWDIRSGDGAGWSDAPTSTFVSATEGVMPVTPGDVDGDGYADIAMTVTAPQALMFVRGPLPPGENIAQEAAFATIDDIWYAYALGDLDDDGTPELSGMLQTDLSQRVLRVPPGGAWGADELSIVASDANYYHQLLPDPDVDGDGRVDVMGGGSPLGNVVWATLAEVRP